MNKSYSKALKLSYTFNDIDIVFEDNIHYSIAEALFISKAKPTDLKAIHICKQVFDGEIITKEPEPETKKVHSSLLELAGIYKNQKYINISEFKRRNI